MIQWLLICLLRNKYWRHKETKHDVVGCIFCYMTSDVQERFFEDLGKNG